MAWVALARVPLVLNATNHLDSDLAVDGLTLIDAVQGRWRWHFPGTPHMGIGPLVLAWPQAQVWGPGPAALVSGGVVAYEAVVLATFLLAWRAFGPVAAAWALVPLAFASTGTVWLSGRLTGGHLLTTAWHAGAFALLLGAAEGGGARRWAALGLWCGLGLYLDRLFLFTLIGLIPAVIVAARTALGRGRGGRSGLAFALAFAVGYLPHEAGLRADPHDAYREQFDPLLDRDAFLGHVRLLALDCLPRLVAGRRLPGLQSEPSPEALGGRVSFGKARGGDPLAAATAAAAMALFAAAMVALMWGPAPAVRWGLLGSSGAIVVAFVLNRNIFNSDNYRYLVFLLVPWSLGFGLMMRRLARRPWGLAGAGALSVALAGLMTADLARWYAGFGWVGPGGGPVRRALRDPAFAWLEAHPEVTHVFGDYWAVYRLSFLTGGRVRGAPYPTYPNRFPGWSRGLGPGRGMMAVIRPGPRWREYLAAAWRDDGRAPGDLDAVRILSWP
jgi:hypothetical protein